MLFSSLFLFFCFLIVITFDNVQPVCDDGRNFNANLCQILRDGQSFVSDIKKNGSKSQNAVQIDNCIDYVCYDNDKKDEDLRTYPNNMLRLRDLLQLPCFANSCDDIQDAED